MLSLGKRALLFIGVHVFALVLLALTAFSQEDGTLVALHDLRVERGRLCMSDHFHVGSSQGQTSKKIAEREAIASWAGFTAWEYGDHWGNIRLAGSRSMKCAQSGTGWACEVQARPCRAISRKSKRGPRKRARRK
ncbi:MAG: hypothetical protein RLZ98_2404 [Pseudomonadota bacterium]|jgi:hypothetical protein